jgi:hypothetical protein
VSKLPLGMVIGALLGLIDCMSAWASRQRSVFLFAAAVGFYGGIGHAQEATPSPLAPLDFLIGRWEGTSEGKPGSGTVQREYSRVLGSQFVEGRNVSTYPPQRKNPKGERHEDIGFFSFDQTRKRLVLRQFHIEGFVNHYVAEVPNGSGAIVFTTEAIENIPAGWRAREIYTVLGPAEVEEQFELAEPGKEYEVYSRTRLRRLDK